MSSEVEVLATRAALVAGRLLKHGIVDVEVTITRRGRTRENPDRLGTGVEVSGSPFVLVPALEELADRLDREQAAGAPVPPATFSRAVDA